MIPVFRSLQVFVPFALGYFLSYLYRVINAVLAPNLAADIGVNPSDLGLLTSTYFITFGAAQIPLGVLLDRFGPRRIEAALLVTAAAGSLIFANASSLTGLIAGRGLIGFGVSACLMAAFKAFVIWFPRHQLPRINGFQMAAGGLGALFATAPVEAALSVTDWRGVFTILSGLTLAVAVLIYFIVPEQETSHQDLDFASQIRGIRSVFSSLVFWRIAPWTSLSQGVLLSIHGLWAGPWLRDVAGMDRPAVANTLMMLAAGMVSGFIVLGMAAERLSRRGIPLMTVAAAGMFIFMMLLPVLVFEPVQWAGTFWILFGFFGTSGILPYAALSQNFPVNLSGRVNTALNLVVFIVAFSLQWGIGAVISRWPSATETGGYSSPGYQAAFIIILALELVTVLWFWIAGVLLRRREGRLE
jgi:sugar phosphate permease